MPIDPSILCRQIEPENTVLLFGAGSSIPSGGMSGAHLAERIADHFTIDYDPSLSLSDVSTIVERRYTRPDLISYVRSLISNLAPTGSLLNLPLYDWKSIYTTNYDLLIEKAYARAKKPLLYTDRTSTSVSTAKRIACASISYTAPLKRMYQTAKTLVS
jgi:hypothetical protein